jgi:osmotically-inducible protein OsmY
VQHSSQEEHTMLDLSRTARLVAAIALFGVAACTKNDDSLSQRVEASIQAEVPAEQVKVTTLRRVVMLEGVVNDAAELNRIDAAARRVPGVLALDNRLVVKPAVNTTGAQP